MNTKVVLNTKAARSWIGFVSEHDGGSEHEGGTEHEGSKKLEWVCQLCTFFNSDDFMCGNCGSFIVQ